MPDITISLTEAQFAALTAAQEHNDLRDKLSRTPAEYLQTVVNGACASYAVQHSVDTVQGLANRLSIESDARARAESDASAKAEQLTAEKAKTASLESEKATAAGGLVGELAKA